MKKRERRWALPLQSFIIKKAVRIEADVYPISFHFKIELIYPGWLAHRERLAERKLESRVGRAVQMMRGVIWVGLILRQTRAAKHRKHRAHAHHQIEQHGGMLSRAAR